MAPPKITGELRDRIQAGLLRIEATRLSRRATRPALAESLEGAYDVYAGELLRAGWSLTAALLIESIPTWVFKWALEHRWLPTTQAVPGVRGNMLEGWIRTDRPARRIPEADLLAGVCKLVTGRIAYWQAEVLSPEVNSKGTRRAVGERLLARAKAQYPMKDIESRIGVSRSTFYKWIENPDSVLDVTADKIIADLHKLVDSTSSE